MKSYSIFGSMGRTVGWARLKSLITGRSQPDILECLLATMPKSGTWYAFFFIEYFDAFLTGRTEINKIAKPYDYPGLGIWKGHGHTMCPGFEEVYYGPHRKKWDELQFKMPGINSGYEPYKKLSPLVNREARLAYLYRNPLDQAVSWHPAPPWDSVGDEIRADLRERIVTFFTEKTMESYVKQFFTWKVMADLYPENIKLFTYEDLMVDPRAVFTQILAHFGFEIETDFERACFERALAASQPDELKKIEAEQGHYLGVPGLKGTHMRGGEIGKWKMWLDNPHAIEHATDLLGAFDMTLDDFQLEDPGLQLTRP